jgi:hypothetical protein
MNTYKVWVEIEELDDNGDGTMLDCSAMLEGASLATFDTLEEAIEYGNRVQREAPPF